MITRPLFRKKLLISVSASEVKANETKKPFVRFSRVMTASNWSMSGRPALSFCLTWIGYHWSMKSKASSRLAGAEDAGNMRPSIPISPTCALLPIPPRAITAQFSNSKMRNSPKVRPRYAASRGRQTRCLKASSNENDIVLNAFCGCGTALVSSQNLGRRWIGIDISPTACRVMADRLRKDCKMLEDEKQWRLGSGFVVRDLPRTEAELRRIPHFEFENWAVIALGGIGNKAQVGDMGIDGRIFPASSAPSKRPDAFDFMDQWYPIQVKQKDKAGRPDIDQFEAVDRKSTRL